MRKRNFVSKPYKTRCFRKQSLSKATMNTNRLDHYRRPKTEDKPWLTKKNENINLLNESRVSVTTSRSFKKTQITQGRKTVGGCLQMLNYGRKSKR